MLGKRGPQRGLFEADTMYGEYVGQDSFYGFLAQHRQELFRDEDFAAMYCANNGGPACRPACWRQRWCCRRTIRCQTKKRGGGRPTTCNGR